MGALRFGLFCAADIAKGQEAALPWVGYDEALASLPQARWTDALRKAQAGVRSGIAVADLETALAAGINGIGLVALPEMVGLQDKGLRAVPLPKEAPTLKREIWMLSHGQETRRSIRAVRDWLARIEWV